MRKEEKITKKIGAFRYIQNNILWFQQSISFNDSPWTTTDCYYCCSLLNLV